MFAINSRFKNFCGLFASKTEIVVSDFSIISYKQSRENNFFGPLTLSPLICPRFYSQCDYLFSINVYFRFNYIVVDLLEREKPAEILI